MHINLHQARVANVGETVHLTGFHDEDVAGANFEFLACDDVSGPPFANEQNLIIRMTMRLRAAARIPFEQDRRHLDVAVLGADEFARAADDREMMLKHSMHGCRRFRIASPTQVTDCTRS